MLSQHKDELIVRLQALLTEWDTMASDDRYNGHMRQVYVVCAKGLREAIGSKPTDDGFEGWEASLQPGERGAK